MFERFPGLLTAFNVAMAIPGARFAVSGFAMGGPGISRGVRDRRLF
jgi:hypothetical protein